MNIDPRLKAITEAGAWAAAAAFLIAFGEQLKDGFQAGDLSIALTAAGAGILAYVRGLKTTDPFRSKNTRRDDGDD